MFEEFFKNCEMRDPENVTQSQSENIKAALQKKLAADNSQQNHSDMKKEKDIMKTKSIRTILIAAAVAVIGAVGVGAASALLTPEEIAAELAEKNSVTPEWVEKVSQWQENAGHELHITPTYGDMEVTEFAVREAEYMDFKGYDDEDFPAIIFHHYDEWGGCEQLITYDGNGGYLYEGKPVTDEKLLEAIAEGTEKYGDTFVIQY